MPRLMLFFTHDPLILHGEEPMFSDPLSTLSWLPLFEIALGMFLLMSLLWIYQVYTHNATIVDVGWTIGMGISSIYLAIHSPGDFGVRLLTAVLLVLWSSRLAIHLIRARLLHMTTEDRRYQAIRAHLGKHANLGFFVLFQAQALFVVLFMAPIMLVFTRIQPLWHWHDSVALLCWVIAIVGESLADKQLEAFKTNTANRGKTCQTGLWAYSRHPNYFFEWMHWFTYPLIAMGTPCWGFTFLLPALMLLFVWKLTGVPYAESQSLKHRSDYAQYQQETSMLIPWMKKKRTMNNVDRG